MERYNYFETVCDDVRLWLNDAEDFKNEHADETGEWLREDNREEIARELEDLLWTNDGVTGNGSGSYTFNAWQAEENLCHNMDLLFEAWDAFGDCPDFRNLSAEACDVTVRCYLLPQAINAVLDEMA